jgi:hypothetical protein
MNQIVARLQRQIEFSERVFGPGQVAETDPWQ